MANDIRIGMQLDDGGSIANKNKDAVALKQNLQAASTAAQNIRVPMATSAARQGVAAKAAAQPSGGASDTNLSRGVAGATGASAKDFAAQAQGLGGLVHVYATFAANLYAVSAAFTALSKAADTTNMVKGLDQLGAQSGRALGTLSKQLIAVSDGALSMRDAMTATALATAGGMSNTNMIRMTQIAKNASLALGRDMTDSMDRLTKGIVKIQPELLDELGIMARVIPSQEAYARQLGKSTSSLTDFEKKQAFANAVLDEGEKKFGAIKIDANPYSKLSASVQNLAQSFLELINSPVGAFATMLADNSVLLGLALAGVAKTLLNQAIPGLRAYKISMADLAKKSKDYATETRANSNQEVSDLTAFLGAKDAAAGKAAENAYKLAYNSRRKIRQLDEGIVGSEIVSIAKKSPFDLTPGEISAIKSKQQELSKSALIAEQDTAKELNNLYNSTNRAKAKAIEIADAAAEESGNKDKTNEKELAKLKARTSDINQRYHLDNIKAITAETQASKGMFAAFGDMNKQLSSVSGGILGKGKVGIGTGTFDKSGKEIMEEVNRLNILQRAAETTSGSYNILKNAASGVMSKLSSFAAKYGEIGAIIAAVVGIIDFAIDALGKNGKEMAIFSKSLDTLKESGDNVERTLAAIQAKDPLERMSLASTAAIASAFIGVADSIDAVVKAGDKAKAKANWMDDLVDFAKRIYGGDIASKTTDSIVSSVSDSIDLLSSNDKLSSKFQTSMMAILKIPKLDSKSIESALDAVDPKDKPELFKKLTEAVKESNREFNNFSATLQTYKASSDTAVKASQDFNLTIMSSDPMFKLGIATINFSRALQDVAKDGQTAKEALQDLVKDSAKMSLLTPDMSSKLLGLSLEFNNNSEAVRANIDNVKALQKAYEDAAAAEDTFIGRWKQRNAVSEGKTTEKESAGSALREANRLKNQQEATQVKLQKEATVLIGEAQYSAFVKGSKLVEISLGNVGEKVALGIDKAAANSLTGLQALRATTDFTKREVDIALRQLDASYQSFTAMEDLRLAVEQGTIQQAINNEKDEGKKAALQIEAAALRMAAEAIKKGPAFVKQLNKAALSAGKTQSEGGKYASTDENDKIKLAGIKVSAAYAAAESLAAKRLEASAKIREQAAANLYTEQVLIAAEKQKELTHEAGLLKFQSDRLGIMQGILQIQDEGVAKTKIDLDNRAEAKKQLSDQEGVQGKINGLVEQIIKEGDTDLRAQHVKQLIGENIAMDKLKENQAAQNTNKILQDSIALTQIRLAMAQRDYDLAVARKNLENLKLTTASDVTQAEFQAQVSLGLISDEYKAKKEASLAVSRAELDLTTAQAAKNAEIIKVQEDADKKKLATGKPGEADYNAENAAFNAKIQNEANAGIAKLEIDKQSNKVNFDGKVKILSITESTNVALAKESELLKDQASYMQDMVTMTTNLSTVFGTVGEAIGKVGEALQSMADSDINYLRRKEQLQSVIFDAMDNQKDEKKAKDAVDAQKLLNKLETQHGKDKLKNESEVLKSVKKLFGEQTTAYKTITGMEKIAATQKIAGDLKQSAIKMGLLSEEQAAKAEALAQDLAMQASAALESIGISIPAIYAQFMAWLGPFGPPAASLAIAAFVGGAFSSGGGEPFVPSIDQGTLAGTGQQAIGSTIGTREGGVLGDPTAQVKSITDSLDMLSQVFFDNMGDTSSNLIQSLKGIQENTYNTAKALGASGVLGGGENPFGVSTGTSPGFDTGVGMLDSALSSLLGGDVSKSITGSGISGMGTASQLAKNAAAIQGYTNVREETSSGWLSGIGIGKGGVTEYAVASKLDESVKKALEGIFTSFNQTLLASAEGLGQTTEGIQQILDKEVIKLKVSKVGLTGSEFAEKLTAEVNVQLNRLASLAYPFLEQYTKVGEESWMVAAKLIKEGETVNFGLSMVGKSFENLGMGSEALVATQQQVIKNFGGTADAFASAIQAYYEALFSDEEKAAFATSNVQTQLQKLGVTGITTKNQLKDLIATKDPTSEIYAKLVKIAPAFASAIDGAQSLADEVKNIADALASSITDQEIKIYGLLGKSSTALAMTREKELAAIEEVLRPRQKYINALTDEVALRDKLKTAYTTSNNALTTSIKTLTDYKNALLVGASSTLSPAEKYAQAKSMLMQTATAAQAVITASSTAAEIAARDIALGKLPAAADALLATSKEVNASGAQYSADFAAATSAIDSTSAILTTQQTDMQAQLGYLETTATSTETMAKLLSDYLSAQQVTALAQADAIASGSTAATLAIPGHARGGLAKGVSIVGERGPEIVDFVNPGRVYSNQASNDLFNTKELVAEIKALRNEVSQLRDDQNKQTGALINSTFEANAQNAEAITNATQAAVNQQDWKTRSQVKVA